MQTTPALRLIWNSFPYPSLNIQFVSPISVMIISFLLFGASNALYSQATVTQLNLSPTEKSTFRDTVKVGATKLPELEPLIADSIITPYYDFLWIHSDGGFVNGTRDSVIKYRYLPTGAIQSVTATAYSTGLYSDKGKRPPRLEGNINVNVAPNPEEYVPVTVVEEGNLLNLQRNHQGLVENDTTVWILSVKNPSKSETWSGQLYLFYESPIEEEFVSAPLTSEELKIGKGKTGVKQVDKIARFRHDTSLIYFNNMPEYTFLIDSILNNQLSNDYKKGLAWQIDSLKPQEEKRVFVQFTNDPNLNSKYDSEAKAKVRFLSMFVGNQAQPSEYPDLSTEDEELSESLGLNEFVDSIFTLYPNTDSEFSDGETSLPFSLLLNEFLGTSSTGLPAQILDIYESEIYAARGHDPNQIEVVTCECPPNADGAQKLITTVDFVNTGGAAANNIYIEIPIPLGININSISNLPLQTDPIIPAYINPADRIQLEIDEKNRVIKWSLEGFSIGTTAEKGVGHPDTEGQIVFSMLTDLGTNINDIDKLYACIAFVEGDDQVCTLPTKVKPIISNPTDLIAEQQFLSCNTCTSDVHVKEVPWWLWILILLVLILCGYIVYENL